MTEKNLLTKSLESIQNLKQNSLLKKTLLIAGIIVSSLAIVTGIILIVLFATSTVLFAKFFY